MTKVPFDAIIELLIDAQWDAGNCDRADCVSCRAIHEVAKWLRSAGKWKDLEAARARRLAELGFEEDESGGRHELPIH